jgi:hypothetical protein
MIRRNGQNVRGFGLGDDSPAVIRQSVLDAWIPFNTGELTWTDSDGETKSSPNEGLRLPSYMYEDILGLVTTGMGNLIETPSTPPTQENPSTEGTITDEGLNAGWTHADGTPASDDEIRAEFANVKAKWSAGHWEPLGGFNENGKEIATLFLPEAAVKKLIFAKLQAFANVLKTQLPEWDSFPADAQMALLSHAWAAGASLGGWPKFKGFINSNPPDWRSAAAEGYVYGPNHTVIAGITPRNDSNVRLMLNAEGVARTGSDPAVLYFPADIGSGGVQVQPRPQMKKVPQRQVPQRYWPTMPAFPPLSKPATNAILVVGVMALTAAAAYVALKRAR